MEQKDEKMQAVTQNASRYWSYPLSGVRKKKHIERREEPKKTVAKVRKSNNGFLTTVFKPLYVGLFNPIFSEKNYRYIYNSMMNYARLLGIKLDVAYNPENLKELYFSFRKILPPNQDCRLKTNEEDNKIKLFIHDNLYENNHLYYLPCNIIDKQEGLFRDILLVFFAHLHQKQRIDLITEGMYFEMISEQIECNEDDDVDKEWLAEINYYKKGYKKDLFDLIEGKPRSSLKELHKQLKAIKPNNQRQINLIKLMVEAIPLLAKDKCIFHYGMPPDYCGEDDYTIEMGEIIKIIYEYDFLVEDHVQYLNECAQESGFDFICAGVKEITPKTKCPLKLDKYVIDFMNWIDKFEDELYY